MTRAGLAAAVSTIGTLAVGTGIAAIAAMAHRRFAAQAEEARRLREMSEATFEALAICDSQGRILDVNTRLEQMLGLGRSSLRGQPASLLLEGPLGSPPDADDLRTGCPGGKGMLGGIPVEVLRRRIGEGTKQRSILAFRDLRERIAAQERIQHLAHHDLLTDLPNRVLLNERLLAECSRAAGTAGYRFALLYLDLNGFKQVNDQFGHAAGDGLLRHIAQRLCTEVRQQDLVARIGGDEFVILASGGGSAAETGLLARRVVTEIEQPWSWEGAPVRISASVGIAFFPEDAQDLETLLRHADIAMYQAKQSGHGGIVFFRPEMQRPVPLPTSPRKAAETLARQEPSRP